ncbi:MAG: phosphoribosylanthranilate isomerase [Methylophilus sp.]
MRTRVKICGITRIEDALAAVELGADAIGLVFYAPSPRSISIEQAISIVESLPPFVSKVGLFVNESPSNIKNILAQVDLDILQFHGDESPEVCEQINMPYYKAIRVKKDTNLIQYAQIYHSAKALLLDTYSESAVGGTGVVFDWKLIPKNISKPLILAGGLTPANVGLAIEKVHPYAVDVSGGVEQSKGIKDVKKMTAFIQAVNQFRS